jgi:hypothetical protein
MPKFMSSHTMPAGALKREQVDQMAKAAQSDPVVKPYRSFLNLAEGKVFCVMEAPSKDALAAWFKKTRPGKHGRTGRRRITALLGIS